MHVYSVNNINFIVTQASLGLEIYNLTVEPVYLPPSGPCVFVRCPNFMG